MLRRDFFQAEIERLAQVLARIIGLKNQGRQNESEELIQNTFLKDFDLEINELLALSTDEFISVLKTKNYQAQKLDFIAQLLFQKIYPLEPQSKTFSLLNKILAIYNLLEEEHHIQSFENLGKREIIERFLRENK